MLLIGTHDASQLERHLSSDERVASRQLHILFPGLQDRMRRGGDTVLLTAKLQDAQRQKATFDSPEINVLLPKTASLIQIVVAAGNNPDRQVHSIASREPDTLEGVTFKQTTITLRFAYPDGTSVTVTTQERDRQKLTLYADGRIHFERDTR